MKHQALVNALPIIAKMLGRKLGVEVVIGADKASTDGQTIYLPPLPVEDEAVAILANGYIDHEAAHIRYTDFDAVSLRGLTGLFTNLLEDIRIERALAADYPGSRQNLKRLVTYLTEQQSPVPPREACIATQVSATLYCQLRTQLLGQTVLASYAARLQQRLDQQLPNGVVTQLLALAFEVRHAQSTSDVHALACEMVKHLEAQHTALVDPPPVSNPGATEAASASDAPTAQAFTPDGIDPGSVTSAAADGGGATQDVPTAPQGTHAAQQAALSALLNTEELPPGLGEQVRQQLQHCTRHAHQQVVQIAEYDLPPPNHDPRAACLKARIATARLSQRLAVLIQAQQDDERQSTARGHRIDTHRLHRLAVNDPQVFVHHLRGETVNTAVGLLLDRSTSMRYKLALASQTTLAIALALEAIDGVASWVAAFPGRQEPSVVPLKRFDEAIRKVAGRFTLPTYGQTPLTQALWRASFELSLRRETRRLLIVITDGKPDDSSSAHKVIARCRTQGIEVLGLGIGMSRVQVTDVFGSAYSNSISSIDDLPPALFKMLAERLVTCHPSRSCA